MTAQEIQEALAAKGLEFNSGEIESKLKSIKLDANDVTPDMLDVWAEELQQNQATKPARRSKGGGLTKPQASAPVTQPPTQSPAPTQQQPTFSNQSITSAIHGTVEQLVMTHNAGEVNAIEAVANYLLRTPERITNGVNQRLGERDVSASFGAMLQQHQANWDATNNSIANLINSLG